VRRSAGPLVLALIVAASLATAVGSAPAGAAWRGINDLNYDDGGRVCRDGVRFGLAHLYPEVKARIINTTPDPDLVVTRRRVVSLPFSPTPELFTDFALGYKYSRNMHLAMSPTAAPGDEIRIEFTNAPGGSGANASVTETVGSCLDAPRFEGFFDPVENPPAVNPATPGEKINLRFGLFGDHGADIFREEPTFAPIPCSSPDTVPAYDPTAASYRLAYLAADDRYVVRWFPPDTLSGCQELFFRTKYSGLAHRALFDFG